MSRLYALILAVGLFASARTLLAPPPVPVLLIHDVSEVRKPGDFWTITPTRLLEIVDLIKKRGFRTLKIDDVQALVDGRLPRERRHDVLVFTVDDGPLSAWKTVGPVLAANGLSGIFFVVSRWGAESHLGASEIKKMVAAGLEIGSHGATHVSLALNPATPGERSVDDSRLWSELSESRHVLSERAGREVTAIAYPKGEFDDRTKRLAKQAGYRLGFTTDPGAIAPGCDPMELPRFQLNWDTPISAIEEYLVSPGETRKRNLMTWLLVAGLALLGVLLSAGKKIAPPSDSIPSATGDSPE